jgi:hypothetical protein
MRALYPRAYEHVDRELKKIGFVSEKIQLVNCNGLLSAASWTKELRIPFSKLDTFLTMQTRGKQASRKQQEEANQIKATLVHEMAHIKRHFVLNMGAPFISLLTTLGIAVRYNIMRRPFIGTMLTTACSEAINNIIYHAKEYDADGRVIARFKQEPQVLIDFAALFLQAHVQDLQYSLATMNSEKDKKRKIDFWYSPTGQAIESWLCDTHGSDIARAHRFLKAAGISSYQWLICQELRKQFEEKYQRSWWTKLPQAFFQETPPDVDMPRIIGACSEFAKKMNAIELPEPFTTYGL